MAGSSSAWPPTTTTLFLSAFFHTSRLFKTQLILVKGEFNLAFSRSTIVPLPKSRAGFGLQFDTRVAWRQLLSIQPPAT